MKQENQPLELEECVSTAAIMKPRISEERVKELAIINKELDAGRARSAQAIFAKAMQK